MSELRFFERLAQKSSARGRSLRGASDGEVLESVITHLRKMLNVRQGSVVIAEDYGGADISYLPSNFSSPETRIYEDQMASMIEKYEPRLSGVHVRFFDESTETSPNITFEVSAHLGPSPFYYSSSIDLLSGQLSDDE